LKTEYTFLSGFLVAFAVLIFLTAEPEFGKGYTTAAFLIGSATSILSGYIGMKIATYTNVRTTKEAAEDICCRLPWWTSSWFCPSRFSLIRSLGSYYRIQSSLFRR
jgi:Na+/H+-translocating membrane pyrophosphatase